MTTKGYLQVAVILGIFWPLILPFSAFALMWAPPLIAFVPTMLVLLQRAATPARAARVFLNSPLIYVGFVALWAPGVWLLSGPSKLPFFDSLGIFAFFLSMFFLFACFYIGLVATVLHFLQQLGAFVDLLPANSTPHTDAGDQRTATQASSTPAPGERGR